MFLPITTQEVQKLGWKSIDVILVSGDTYIDSSFSGIALIGKYLLSKGFTVAVIPQPSVDSDIDIKRFGEPNLFWGISSGCVDSMVANYTAMKKKRRSDDFTPGGENTKRPDRALLAYSNLIRRFFKNTKPIVLGGIEASLRRASHYDYWSDSVRRSILFDAKADYLVYGMGEKTVFQIAQKLRAGKNTEDIKGICYISKEPRYEYVELPSYEKTSTDKAKFTAMFKKFYDNNDPLTAKGLYQKHGERFLIQNPPQDLLSEAEIDEIYNLEFHRDAHPELKKLGKVKALDTIKYSVTTHRGCYGECNFCAIAVHQGRTICSRSIDSVVKEVEDIAKMKDFKGYITDLGGPTANMYQIECAKKLKSGVCLDKRCLYPETCKALRVNHSSQLELLKRVRRIKNIKKVFVSSGIRFDMILNDKKHGEEYLKEIIINHTSGQMKIAPEHTDPKILKLMGKPVGNSLKQFKDLFYKINKERNLKQFLTYYFISAHPGCEFKEMNNLNNFIKSELKVSPEQVQIFTPTPSTYSTLMYYTGVNPFTNEKIYVEKDSLKKEKQKTMVTDSECNNNSFNPKKTKRSK